MFHKILFPIDISEMEHSEPIAAKVAELANCHDCEIRLLGVVPDVGMPIVGLHIPRVDRKKVLDEALAALNAFGEKHFSGTVSWKAKIREGRAHKEIIREVKEKKPDLIIMPSHHRKGADQLIGSVAERVAERAECSVLILRD